MCLSITSRSFLFHHCTLAKMQFCTPQNILRTQIVTSHLIFLLDKMARGSGTNLFIHIAAYGRGGIFVNFMIPSMLTKITITSTFGHRFRHVMRQIICLFISFPSIYHINMFKAKWDRQLKVYVNFSKNIVRDIFCKTVLKIKICEKSKISGMLLISPIKIF